MKTITQLCISLLLSQMFFIACNHTDAENKNEEKKESTSVEQAVKADDLNCKSCINKVSAWNSVRTNMNAVKEIFTRSGNHFSYTPIEGDSILQIYIGYNEETKKMECYAVSFSKPSDLHCKNIPLSATKDTINVNSILHSLQKPNHDSIPLEEGAKRVKNWINRDIRNDWLSSTFQHYGDSAVFLAFAIPLTDLSYGDKHNFYFALEELDSPPGTYHPDLVIVNYSSGTFLNIEDMVHSVPPFGCYPSTQYNRFEILKKLNIK